MEIPGHRIDSLIREVPGSRLVVRSFARGRNCVTRVLLSDKVDPKLTGEVERIVLTGEGFAPLSRSLDLTLAGYRVAARLPRDPSMPWTSAVAAGVNPEGYVYVSTRWMEGTPLHHLLGQLSDRRRRQIVQDVARILVELHSRSIAYGDFKADNLVMSPNGQMALIDLDTLRLVPGPTMPAVTQDVTRSWAAPEQFQQKTYLSSDIYAFGRLLTEMFGDELPLEWLDVVEACRLADPLQRPQTSLVYQRLRGQRVELRDWNNQPTPPLAPPLDSVTERVPDEIPASPLYSPQVTGPVPLQPGETFPEEIEENVVDVVIPSIDGPTVLPETAPPELPQEPTVEPQPSGSPRVQPPRPAGRSSLGSCLLFLGGMLAFATLLCMGFGFWVRTDQLNRADALADKTLAAMRDYKTDPKINEDSSQRSDIRRSADEAWKLAETSKTGGVRALAVVWEQGWQDSGKSWNSAQFNTGNKAVGDAPDADQAEALLASALLDSASCRFNPSLSTASAACSDSLKTLDRFLSKDEEEVPDWLRVEGLWVKVMVLSQQYFSAIKSGSDAATTRLAEARGVCGLVPPLLSSAPVNGPELLEDCLVLDGQALDVDAFLSTAALLMDADRDAALRHFYTSAGPGCEKLTFKKGSKAEPSAKSDTWCVAMGLAAQNQWYASAMLVSTHPDDGRPWDALQARIQREGIIVPARPQNVPARPFWDNDPGGE